MVYTENTYETALLASTYASLVNAPLVVQGHEPASFTPETEQLLCIGETGGVPCTRHLTLAELREEYLVEIDQKQLDFILELVESL